MRSRNLLALKMTKNQNKEPDYDEDEDLLEQEQEVIQETDPLQLQDKLAEHWSLYHYLNL
jgi:hypothetical protein